MEIHNQLKTLSNKIETMKEQIKTEEATKNAFVMPFINDIYNFEKELLETLGYYD